MWSEIQRRITSTVSLMFEPEQIAYPNPTRKNPNWPIRITINSFTINYVEIAGGPTGIILTVSGATGKIQQLLFKDVNTQMKDMLIELNKVLEYVDQTRKT